MRKNHYRNKYVSSFILLFCFLLVLPLSAADMKDYCIIPPYVKRDVKPNILIIMDNSYIMGEAAYNEPYDASKTYAGLYQSGLMYTYNTTFKPDPAGIYSGNLLNWATTSKYDLLQSILVGGKSVSRQTNVNTLLSMSNTWEKTLTYRDSLGRSRVCKFVVSNANLEIKDDKAGSCGYLDAPPYPLIASNEGDMRYAINEPENKQRDSVVSKNILAYVMKFSSDILSSLMNFLIPEAEAANLKLPSGNTPAGTECTPYSAIISASGGTEIGYTWSITTGSLPAGLSMAPTGTPSTTISGTPTVSSGTYNFTVQVCDSAGCINRHMASKDYSITINDATVSITTSSPMPDGTFGSWYRSPVRAGGVCTSSTTWIRTAGTLPTGLSLCACTSGTDCTDICGTPSAAGTYNFTLQVTDSKSNTAAKAFSLTINPSAASFQIVTASPLTDATEGVPYLVDISTSGSTCGACCSCPATYTWSITAGSLPAGLSFNTGGPCVDGDHVYITGTPTNTGTFNFTVQVTDCNGNTATKAFSLTVSSAPVEIRTTGNLSVKVCAGDYSVNCENPDSTAPYEEPCSKNYTDKCVLKTGIVDQFWPQARFGIEDFNKVSGKAIPDISNCIEGDPGAEPDSDFMTAIENAIPIDPVTTLVNGAYTAIDYYANDTSSNCDPFRNSEACQRNFILMISSGVGADNPPVPSGGTPNVFSVAEPCNNANYANLTKNSCYGQYNDLRASLAGKQNVNTYIVNTMGTAASLSEIQGYCIASDEPSTTGDIMCQAAKVGGGEYYQVTDPAKLRETLIQAFQDILKRAASGTAASVLASGEGQGANLVQAVFYPRTQKIELGGIFDTEIMWIGRLTNLWYYVDPFFRNSSMREDTVKESPQRKLNLINDNIVQTYFDYIAEQTKARRWIDSDGDGDSDSSTTTVTLENIGSLWEAGLELWKRDLNTDPRTIYTVGSNILGSPTLIGFNIGNASLLKTNLQASNEDDAQAIIKYIHGEDNPQVGTTTYSFRRRTVGLKIDGVVQPSRVWKLGDILNSTPKIASWIQLNTYEQIYGDTSYKKYLETTGYKNRGMVFTGGNDGMLHAFKLGKLELPGREGNKCGFGNKDKACLYNDSSVPLGHEMWAFIPKNALPYLKYMAEDSYCHIFTVDLTPYIFDASIGAGADDISNEDKPTEEDKLTWRTIIIGGMRFGGASKNYDAACTDCVKTPLDGVGYSSYFALDITDNLSNPASEPKLLWEFSDPGLGFATTGPAIVRVGERTKNGKWFVVIGSGPTGPIDTTEQQFLGHSDQNLKIFIFDLKQGPTAGNKWVLDTGIQKAFAGSMLNATHDSNLDYQDDVVYIPYVKDDGSNTWTKGGVGRLVTKDDPNPSNWAWSKVIDNIGPVTSAVVRLQKEKKKLWLYFGSGRYYFERFNFIDDQEGQQHLFGMTEPCFQNGAFNWGCSESRSMGDLSTCDLTTTKGVENDKGWFINLDGYIPYSVYGAERVITDPLSSLTGLVYFTSYKPYIDECAYGGVSHIWSVKYDTCAAPGSLLKGTALLQVSTGSIEQVNLSKAFPDDDTHKKGRRTSELIGVPPVSQGLSLMTTPPPVNRVIHMKER